MQPTCPSTNGLPRSVQFNRYRVDAFAISQHFSKRGAMVFLFRGLYRTDPRAMSVAKDARPTRRSAPLLRGQAFNDLPDQRSIKAQRQVDGKVRQGPNIKPGSCGKKRFLQWNWR
jgi:hypothetical protein